MSHFCRLNISDSLKLSHFNDAYALMLKDLTKLNRKDSTLLWSLMPDLAKNGEFTELLGEIWQELAKHELFYSCTEGWGYVAIEDMVSNFKFKKPYFLGLYFYTRKTIYLLNGNLKTRAHGKIN